MEMKKKVTKKKKPTKQKIDIVIESLVNLEQRTKELINRIEQLERIMCNYPKYPEPKYWPNIPYKNNDKAWGCWWK